jgi:cell division septal protein FtsQ
MIKVRDFHSQSWDNPFARQRGSGFWSRVLSAALVIAAAAVAAYVFIYSPFLRISKVQVVGAKSVDPRRIEAAAEQALAGYEYLLWPNDYFFTVNTAGIRNRLLMQFALLRDADVSKKFGKIVISVDEKTPSFRLVIGDKSYLLDQDGIGLKEAGQGEGDSLIALSQDGASYVAGKSLVPFTWLQPINDLHKYFATLVGIRDKILRINLANRSLEAESTEGWHAVIDPFMPIKPQLESLSAALAGKFNPIDRQKLLYIDVRFGDKIYYKLR